MSLNPFKRKTVVVKQTAQPPVTPSVVIDANSEWQERCQKFFTRQLGLPFKLKFLENSAWAVAILPTGEIFRQKIAVGKCGRFTGISLFDGCWSFVNRLKKHLTGELMNGDGI